MGQVASHEKNEETTLLLEETNVINKECEDKIRPYLELAKKYSLIDDEKRMQNQIKKAYQLSNTLGINIKQNVNNIIEPFYIKKVDQYLRWANEAALEGDEENMKHYSQRAIHYATKMNLNIDNQINNIKCGDTKKFLANQVQKYLRWADEEALKGNEDDMKIYIHYAKINAMKINLNIDHQINNIKCGDTKTFLTNQMNKYLQWAREANNSNDKIFYIELARKKAKRLNINIDHIIKLI